MIQKMVPQNFEMITKDYEASGEKPQVMNAEDAFPYSLPMFWHSSCSNVT